AANKHNWRVWRYPEAQVMKRGGIWWVNFDERCPAVFLSSLTADAVRAILIVAPAQSKIDQLLEIDVGPVEGLPFEGVVRIALPGPGYIPCTWLVTLSPTAFLDHIGNLSDTKLSRLDEALRRAGLE